MISTTQGIRPAPEFPNLLSRLLLGRAFERQFVLPPPPPRWLERLLVAWERHGLGIDLSGIRVDRPVFLFGLPRSGTTLLYQLIACHPDLGYITNGMHPFPEGFCAAHVLCRRLGLEMRCERYLGDSVEIELGSPNDGLRFWAKWSGIDLYEIDHEKVCRGPQDLTPAGRAAVDTGIRKVLWCFGGEDRRFANKNPALLAFLDLLGAIFPEGKLLHLVRDPRLCANSLVKLYRRTRAQEDRLRARGWLGPRNTPHFVPYPRLPGLAGYLRSWGPEDLRTAAHLWKEGVEQVEERRDLLRIYEVRWEDLLRRPEEELARIFAFCELPPINGRSGRFRELLARVGKIHHRNDYGGFEQIEEICGGTMERYGYSRSRLCEA